MRTPITIIVALLSVGCGAGGKACAIIDAAHQACTVVRYLGPNGEQREVKVTKAELEAFARETAERQAAMPGAGQP